MKKKAKTRGKRVREKADYQETTCGFKWGLLEILRVTEVYGHVVVSLKVGATKEILVQCSPKGKNVHAVFYGDWPEGTIKLLRRGKARMLVPEDTL